MNLKRVIAMWMISGNRKCKRHYKVKCVKENTIYIRLVAAQSFSGRSLESSRVEVVQLSGNSDDDSEVHIEDSVAANSWNDVIVGSGEELVATSASTKPDSITIWLMWKTAITHHYKTSTRRWLYEEYQLFNQVFCSLFTFYRESTTCCEYAFYYISFGSFYVTHPFSFQCILREGDYGPIMFAHPSYICLLSSVEEPIWTEFEGWNLMWWKPNLGLTLVVSFAPAVIIKKHRYTQWTKLNQRWKNGSQNYCIATFLIFSQPHLTNFCPSLEQSKQSTSSTSVFTFLLLPNCF